MAAPTGAGGNSDPEDASAFLTRTNFKSIVEWLTAEAILNRPEDPMTYVRDLCDMKLCERGAEAYALRERMARQRQGPAGQLAPVAARWAEMGTDRAAAALRREACRDPQLVTVHALGAVR